MFRPDSDIVYLCDVRATALRNINEPVAAAVLIEIGDCSGAQYELRRDAARDRYPQWSATVVKNGIANSRGLTLHRADYEVYGTGTT